MQKNTAPLPDWEQVLSSAARLQGILPEAVRFDLILAELESVAGWKNARLQRPVLILGSLDGIETGVRQLIRDEPLGTTVLALRDLRIQLPTEAEILRIKAVLILKRNATRDYLDFVALADHLGVDAMADALLPFDWLYPQPNGESALQQLQVQLASAQPFDLDDTDLSEYKNLAVRWQDWGVVSAACAHAASLIFDRVCDLRPGDRATGDDSP